MTRKERYGLAKQERKCVDCNDELQVDNGVRCESCAKKRNVSHLRYQRKNRKKVNAQKRATRRKRRDHYVAKARERRNGYILSGRCTSCPEDALDDSQYCEYHRDEMRALQRNWWRKKHGKTGLEVVAKSADVIRLAAYRPLDQCLRSPWVLILRKAKFLDWTSSAELIDEAGAPAFEGGKRGERSNWTQVVRRAFVKGFLERRPISRSTGNHRGGGSWEYRITQAGRGHLVTLLQEAERKALVAA